MTRQYFRLGKILFLMDVRVKPAHDKASRHLGLFAAMPDHRQRIARGAASRIMIDRHAHNWASFAIGTPSPPARSNQLISINAATAPQSSAAMKPGRSVGRIPEKVLVIDRA